MFHAMIAWVIRLSFKFSSYAALAVGLAAITAWLAANSVQLPADLAALNDFVLALNDFVLKISVTLLIAGLALAYLSHSRRPLLPNEAHNNTATAEPVPKGWLSLLGLCLLVLAFVALARLGPLKELWAATVDLAARWNLTTEIGGAQDFAGLMILLPVLAALLVPIIESLTVASFILCSACLLPLFAFRSRFFPRVFLMSILLQFALVLSVSFAMNLDIVGRVRNAIERESPEGDDVDLRLFNVWAERHQATVGPVASTLIWTFVGYAIWLPILFVSGRVRTFFARDPAVGARFKFLTNLAMSRIRFDGKTYRSADEMPAEVRERYNRVLATVAETEQEPARTAIAVLVLGAALGAMFVWLVW